MELLNYKNEKTFRDICIKPLRKTGLLTTTFPESPTHPENCYKTTEPGIDFSNDEPYKEVTLMNDEHKKELFTERITAGSRSYFFDVKESSNGDKYLVISESKKTETDFEHHRIMVFEEHLIEFSEGLKKALNFLNIKKKSV